MQSISSGQEMCEKEKGCLYEAGKLVKLTNDVVFSTLAGVMGPVGRACAVLPARVGVGSSSSVPSAGSGVVALVREAGVVQRVPEQILLIPVHRQTPHATNKVHSRNLKSSVTGVTGKSTQFH